MDYDEPGMIFIRSVKHAKVVLILRNENAAGADGIFGYRRVAGSGSERADHRFGVVAGCGECAKGTRPTRVLIEK